MKHSILQRLRSEFLAWGFDLVERDTNSFDVRRDASRMTTQEVHVFLSSLEQDTFLVRVAVGVRLFIREPSGVLIRDALAHEIGRNGMFPVEWNVCRGWPASDMDTAIRAISHTALPWLEQQSEVGSLVNSLERILGEGQSTRPPTEPIGRRLLARWLNPVDASVSEVLRPPIYNEMLANLYAEIGELKRSRECMRRWVSHMGDTPETRPYRLHLEAGH